MAHNKIKCKTFSMRAFSCSYYSQEDNYAKIIRLLFEKVISTYKTDGIIDSTSNFVDSFYNEYENKCFSGITYVYRNDREQFTTHCQTIARSLQTFIDTYKVDNIFDKYEYSRVTGSVGCTAEINSKLYTIDFSFRTLEDTFDWLFYHKFNTFLYNKSKDLTNDCLVLALSSDSQYLIKYNKNDYTIRYGYITSCINNKAYSPGRLCLTCKVKHCSPRLIPTLGRL